MEFIDKSISLSQSLREVFGVSVFIFRIIFCCCCCLPIHSRSLRTNSVCYSTQKSDSVRHSHASNLLCIWVNRFSIKSSIFNFDFYFSCCVGGFVSGKKIYENNRKLEHFIEIEREKRILKLERVKRCTTCTRILLSSAWVATPAVFAHS